MLSPDMLLAGKYRIVRILGQGSFGVIYLGRDEGIGRDVAIKELLGDAATVSPETWQDYQMRFRKEAQVMRQSSHPNIVTAYTIDTDSAGNLYLVLEYVDGGSLKEAIETSGALPIERALDIAIDICQAIEAIYKRDVVHRDIKPSNILLSSDGTAKLTDFGIAQVGHETRRTQESTGHPGTPAYKSPEQATTTGYLDQRSDLYALGLVLYEMLTGHLYVHHRVPPHQHRADIPQALNAIVMKALESDPAQRYQSAGDMRRDLEQVREQNTLGQLRVVLRGAPRRYAIPVALFVALLLLGSGINHLGHVLGDLQASPSATQPLSSTTPPNQPTLIVAAQLEAARLPLASQLQTPSSVPENTRIPPNEQGAPDDAPIMIAPGETLSRSFDHEGDIGHFAFRSKAGRRYIITTSNLGAGVDTRLEVTAGAQRYANDDISPGTLASQVTFDASEDSTVIIAVINQGLFGPGRTYDLSVMVSAVPPTETPWPSTSREIDSGGDDRATFTPRPTFTREATATLRPTSTLRATSTPRPTSTTRPTWTRVPTATRTPAHTSTPSITPTPSITATPSPTRTSVPPTDIPPTSTHTPPPPTEEPTKTPTPERTPLPTSEPGPPGE